MSNVQFLVSKLIEHMWREQSRLPVAMRLSDSSIIDQTLKEYNPYNCICGLRFLIGKERWFMVYDL